MTGTSNLIDAGNTIKHKNIIIFDVVLTIISSCLGSIFFVVNLLFGRYYYLIAAILMYISSFFIRKLKSQKIKADKEIILFLIANAAGMLAYDFLFENDLTILSKAESEFNIYIVLFYLVVLFSFWLFKNKKISDNKKMWLFITVPLLLAVVVQYNFEFVSKISPIIDFLSVGPIYYSLLILFGFRNTTETLDKWGMF